MSTAADLSPEKPYPLGSVGIGGSRAQRISGPPNSLNVTKPSNNESKYAVPQQNFRLRQRIETHTYARLSGRMLSTPPPPHAIEVPREKGGARFLRLHSGGQYPGLSGANQRGPQPRTTNTVRNSVRTQQRNAVARYNDLNRRSGQIGIEHCSCKIRDIRSLLQRRRDESERNPILVCGPILAIFASALRMSSPDGTSTGPARMSARSGVRI